VFVMISSNHFRKQHGARRNTTSHRDRRAQIRFRLSQYRK